jgi:hypothetical protein
MRCRTHEIGFTLYPPGYPPWGRKPWVREGGVAKVEDDVENNAERFRNTYFDAALEAAAGIFWPREKVLDAEFGTPSDLTQHCHLSRAIRLLGIDQEPFRRELFAELFSLPGQILHEAAVLIGQRPHLADLGRVVRTVLEAIPSTLTGVFESLVIGGAAVGLWPPLHVWRPALHRLVPRVFPAGGSPAAVRHP